MARVNGRQILFAEAIAAVEQKHPSAKARSALSEFQAKFLSDKGLLTPRQALAFLRYGHAERQLMRNENTALAATVVTRENETLTPAIIADIRRTMYKHYAYLDQIRTKLAVFIHIPLVVGTVAAFAIIGDRVNKLSTGSVVFAGIVTATALLLPMIMERVENHIVNSFMKKNWTPEIERHFEPRAQTS